MEQLCKFNECKNKLTGNTRRNSVKEKMLQVYCEDCFSLHYHDDGTPQLIYLYGGLDQIWKRMMEFCFEFSERYNIELVYDPDKLEMPEVVFDTRKQRSDKKGSDITYGTADLDDWVATIYIRRAKSPERLFDTVLHELVHFVAFAIFNQPLDILDGHTKVFWKFLFDFSDYIWFNIPLEV